MQIHRVFGLAFVLAAFALGCSCGSEEGALASNGIDDPCPDDCGGNCTDVSNDPDNCGACGSACDGATPVCADGQCVPSCPQGTLDCDDACVDDRTDEENCGGCGIDCPQGIECIGGGCGENGGGDCRTGEVDCGGGVCADLSSDERHCGDCDQDCGAGGSCGSGVCECVSGTVDCGGDGCFDLSTSASHCGDCDQQCDDGRGVCESGVCVEQGDVCGDGQDDCDPGDGVQCVDTDWNSEHCGECFNQCAADEICNDGGCDGFYTPECNCFKAACGCEQDFICCDIEGVGTGCLEDDECP